MVRWKQMEFFNEHFEKTRQVSRSLDTGSAFREGGAGFFQGPLSDQDALRDRPASSALTSWVSLETRAHAHAQTRRVGTGRQPVLAGSPLWLEAKGNWKPVYLQPAPFRLSSCHCAA